MIPEYTLLFTLLFFVETVQTADQLHEEKQIPEYARVFFFFFFFFIYYTSFGLRRDQIFFGTISYESNNLSCFPTINWFHVYSDRVCVEVEFWSKLHEPKTSSTLEKKTIPEYKRMVDFIPSTRFGRNCKPQISSTKEWFEITHCWFYSFYAFWSKLCKLQIISTQKILQYARTGFIPFPPKIEAWINRSAPQKKLVFQNAYV